MAEPLGINLPITPAGGVDSRPNQGPTLASVTPREDGSRGHGQDAPSTELHLGTVVEAIVRAPAVPASADALPVGTHLMLRIVAVPAGPSELLIGSVISLGTSETLIDTPLGLLAVQRRLALAPGTIIAFERLEEIAPCAAAHASSTFGGWPALEEALAALAAASPELAARLRHELTPASSTEFVSAMLFLLGDLYRRDWPGAAVRAALGAANRGELAQQLDDDAEESRRLAHDPATGEWRVLTLPLLRRQRVLPLRLFVRRQPPSMASEEPIRLAIEIEIPSLGPLQLDGMLRGSHLILILRSHHRLPEALRERAKAACHRALPAWGLTGDLSFAIETKFALAPLSNLRKHVEMSV